MKYLFCLIFVDRVLGWGEDGHRIITALAQDMLTDTASTFLGNNMDDLVKASLWADSDDAETRYPGSGAYHFSSTPYRRCAAFDMKRDCGFGLTKGRCIVTGLADAIERAMDINVSKTVRADSLKFILHLMADIHQPLHTGFREDTGGVRIPISCPKKTDLHYIWDTWLISEMKRKSALSDWTGVANAIAPKLANPAFTNRLTNFNITDVLSSRDKILKYVSGLASETSTSTTCAYGYKQPNGDWVAPNDVVNDEFFTTRQPIMTVQLLKAAVRLSFLLEGISAEFYRRRSMYREVRREERLERLFVDNAVPAPLTGSTDPTDRFGVLWIDDPIDTTDLPPLRIREFVAVAGVNKKSKKATKKSKERADEMSLLSAIDDVLAERRSYTFFGVDLSDIILINSRGRLLITSGARRSLFDRKAKSVPGATYVTVNYGASGNVTRRTFCLDRELIGNETENDQLFIRMILKISNVDPRIDITDYMETLRPIRRSHTDITRTLIGLLVDDQTELKRADEDPTWPNLRERIVLNRNKIISKNMLNGALVFAHIDSFTDMTAIRRKFVWFIIPPIGTSGKLVSQIYVDARIARDITISSPELVVLSKIALENSFIFDEFATNSFWDELLEMTNLVESREVGLPDADLNYIGWLYNYPANTLRSARVIEWFTKGTFESEEAIADFYGFSEIPTALPPS